MIAIAELLPDAEAVAEAHRERLADRAYAMLLERPEHRRAACMEQDGKGYRAGLAVRMAGGIATACLPVPACDPFALLAAFDRHAEGGSTDGPAANSRNAPMPARDASCNPRWLRQQLPEQVENEASA